MRRVEKDGPINLVGFDDWADKIRCKWVENMDVWADDWIQKDGPKKWENSQ